MKIVLVGQFGLESFGLHIRDSLVEMGHEVVACIPFYEENIHGKRKKISVATKIKKSFQDKLLFSGRKTRDRIMKRIMSVILNTECELIICTKDYFLDYELQAIKDKIHAKIVMWYPDHIVSFGRASFLCAGYDALFFKDLYIVKNMRKIYKRPAYYLPECFNPIRHPLVEENAADRERFACEISMIGNLHVFRVAILEQLIDFDLRIYGTANPWWLNIDLIKNKYTGQYLAYEDKSKAIRYSKINLNTLYIGEVEGVNVRAFEIAGMGGFQILQNKSGISDLFEIDKELVTYDSIEELREKARYYIEHDEERETIAKAGLERAYKDHTYVQRLTRLINMTFLDSSDEHDWYDYHCMGVNI